MSTTGSLPPPDPGLTNNVSSPFSFVESAQDKTIDKTSTTAFQTTDKSYQAQKPDISEHKWSNITATLSSAISTVKNAALNLATSVAKLWNKIFDKSMVIDDTGYQNLYQHIESQNKPLETPHMAPAESRQETGREVHHEAERAVEDLQQAADEAVQIEAPPPDPERMKAAAKDAAIKFSNFRKDFKGQLDNIQREANPADLEKLAKADEKLSDAFEKIAREPTKENINNLVAAHENLRTVADAVKQNTNAAKKEIVDNFKKEIASIKEGLEKNHLKDKSSIWMHGPLMMADKQANEEIEKNLTLANNYLRFSDVKFDPKEALNNIQQLVKKRNEELEKVNNSQSNNPAKNDVLDFIKTTKTNVDKARDLASPDEKEALDSLEEVQTQALNRFNANPNNAKNKDDLFKATSSLSDYANRIRSI